MLAESRQRACLSPSALQFLLEAGETSPEHMPSSFSCPQCRRRLRGIPVSGRLDMACAACGYRFRMIQGRIVGESSSQAQERAPGDSTTTWAMTVGAMTTIAIAFLMGYFERDVGPALISASFGGIASGAWLKWQMTPVVPVRYLTSETRAAFATAEQLNKAKGKLMLSRNGHTAALKNKLDLRRRLTGLRTKMEELALPAYRPRIASIDAGLVTLDKQIDMDTRLRNGYAKSIKMIEIELEAGAAADQMNQDISVAIAEAMSELQALEETQAELTRQLEANVEVEQLLRVREAGSGKRDALPATR